MSTVHPPYFGIRIKWAIHLLCLLLPAFTADAQTTPKRFHKLTPDQTGVYFRNDVVETDSNNISNNVSYGGGGVAVGDLNNDGLPDIVFISNQHGPVLYMNKGHMKFEDVTKKAGLSGYQGWFDGVNIVDVNGDGWNDIFVCQSHGDRHKLLFINNRDGTFTESAFAYGITDGGATTQSLFFDFNNDGYLDLLLLNSLPGHESDDECRESDFIGLANGFDVRHFLSSSQYPCWGPRLLMNRGDHFEDVTSSVGMQKQVSFPLSAVACDFDFDGYTDIFIGNTFISPDLLYHNNHGQTLQNVAPEYFKHSSLNSMGSDYADINADGIPDLMVADMLSSTHFQTKNDMSTFSYEFYHLMNTKISPPQFITNSLFLGGLTPPFSEVANQANVARTDWTWSVLIQDFDNDGMNDIFTTQGTKKDEMYLDFFNIMSNNDNPDYSLKPDKFYQNLPTYRLHNFMFHNEGNISFKDVTKAWGLDDLGISNGAAYADLDGDGDLDLVVNNTDTFAAIYENMTNVIGDNNYIRFKLVGNNHNTAGLGAFVKIYYQGNEHVEYLGNTHGFLSSTEPIAHFGLGKATMVDSAECFWPGGDYQVFRNLKADSLYTLHQESGIRKIYHPTVVKQNLLEEVHPNSTPILHHENYYVDFKRDRLQPFKLSAEGPDIAVGDINKDGRQDFYIGAAKGSPGQLWIQQKDGSFKLQRGPWSDDSSVENQGCVIADFNKDGWNDLLIANGSGENYKDDKGNALKLYLNDGKGHFIDASYLIPQKDICYSSVSVCDFNGDGYLDILAAGRLTLQAYPLPTSSRLLVNHKGKFVDETDSLAPDLNNIGNVRSAIWSDFDNDGKQDIVLAGEWMPVTFLHNENGTFVKVKGNPSVDSAFGLWTNIIQADFNHDGLMDYIVCNYGTNSYLKATHDEPLLLYYDDFDDNGVNEPLVFHYIHDSLGILYDRDTYLDQMPKNRGKFLTYRSYASAKMNDFISPEKMKTAKKFIVNEMRTSYIENLGGGKFKMTPLPVDCQLSAMYGALPVDVNGDGNMDVVMVGNSDVNLYQYTPMDATPGVVLINDGKGNFKALKPEESGFRNDGYGRCLKLIDVGKKPMLLVGNNNGPMKFFRLPKVKLK